MSINNSDIASISDDHDEQREAPVGVPTVYLKEYDVFGWRKPGKPLQWLEPSEIYTELIKVVEPCNIKGLQRVRGMWRIHFATLNDKVKVMASGVHLRGRKISVLSTFPTRLDGERTVRIRIKNIPLTIDDEEVIKHNLTLKGIEVISMYRERLTVNGNLTITENGDRIVTVSALSLKTPLAKFTDFGKYSAHVIHAGQSGESSNEKRPRKCSKCLLDGHTFSSCPNDWVCRTCNRPGHKASDCLYNNDIESEHDADSETGSEQSSDSTCISEVHVKSFTSVVQAQGPRPGATISTSPLASSGIGRGSILQKSMGESILSHTTPNKDKPQLVKERSPPTPADEYREKCNVKSTKKHHRKK
jgi:hypothetical protein